MQVGARLMVEAMARLAAGDLPLVPQAAEGVTYARKIDKAETRIDWSRPAAEVSAAIRGLSPHPGAWCEVAVAGRPERLKVLRCVVGEGSGAPGTVLDGDLRVACGEGAVRLVEVQRAGGRPSAAVDFLRGTRIAVGERLS
jgi:methionyl-tRNA formyltransferase